MLSVRCRPFIIKTGDGLITVHPEDRVELSDKIGAWRDGVPYLHWRAIGPNRLTRATPFTELSLYFNYTEPQYTDYLLRWLNVHENQYTAGLQILDCYSVGMRKVILSAEMQSGKTGTVRYVAHQLLHCSDTPLTEAKPEELYFICGLNDNDLRTQAIKEFRGIIPECNILFSKQLQKHNKRDSSPVVKFLVIDESHYASNVDSQVDLFVKRVSDQDPFTLSVSATAMAELATSTAHCKGHVILRPGPGYYSISELFTRGLVRQSVDITQNQVAFIDLIADQCQEQQDHEDRKYNIVRLPNQWYYKDLEEELRVLDLPIDFINHHNSEPTVDDFNVYIAEPPSRMTIIWIYNSLRAGKQLNTKHIGFVHDTASSSPDTIAQSLLGRILGYGKRNDHVICYTDAHAAKLFLDWVSHTYDVAYIPRGSRGIVHGYSDKRYTWTIHTPILVQMPAEMRQHYRTLKQRHGNRYPYKDAFLEDIVLSSDLDQDKLRTVFMTHDSGRCGGLTIITEANAERTYNDYWCRNYSSYVKGDPVRGFDAFVPGKYFHVFVNLHIDSPQYGCAMVTYKEYCNGARTAEHVRVNRTSRHGGGGGTPP